MKISATTSDRLRAYLRHVPPGSKLTAEQTARVLAAVPLQAHDARSVTRPGRYLTVCREGGGELVDAFGDGILWVKLAGAFTVPTGVTFAGRCWHGPVEVEA